MTTKHFLCSVSLIVVGLVTGCNRALPPEAEGVLYCAEGNPEAFNPQLVTSGTTLDMTSSQLFDRLIEYNESSREFESSLAEHWSVSEDNLRYRFKLREDVPFHSTDFFHPTRNLNAQDVVFTFNRWLKPEHPYHEISGGQYPFFTATRLDQLIREVSATSSHEVEITLREPDSSLLSILASSFAVIMSAEYGQQLLNQGEPQQFDLEPIGTGPFKFSHFRKDVALNYVRHDEYWKGPAASENLVFRIAPNDHKRMLMLLTQDCDISPYPPARDIAWLDEREDIHLQTSMSPNTAFWAFNTDKAPFNDIKVRQALAHAIDRDALISAVYFDHAVRADSILPNTSWAHSPTPEAFRYDPQRARELLDEAGYGSGFTMDVWALPVQRAYNPNARLMAELIQSNLNDIGVNVNIVSYEWSSFRRSLAEGAHDSVLIGWSADHADPDNFFRPLLTCAAKASGNNRAMWCNEIFDNLVTNAIRSIDRPTRESFYHQAQDILAQEVPVVPLAHSIRFQASRDYIQGLQPPAYGGINLRSVSKVAEIERGEP
ncbi:MULTISPECIES: ABC transporter substrate-binding protein [Gammaproteobacteria]|uniref:ABC transporter substrate-binding protein n=1 Tax=Gammaproteobacteria TaxID=1236 RepID=UPI000DD04277|nr:MULTISPECIES: ABC transporter substrate-binding protein [Gammaproteobacteria]RTE87136.1 ABC transporter substrate-binding protein [Aliidiomarina sp. B3213]TCZ93076.1 ABC transporter substrate-binding protein [Lysobacter sp. N42]